MFAVIESGGKQYKVTEGQTLLVDLFDAPKDNKVTFDKVLLVSSGDSVSIGQPIVESAVVKAEFLSVEKGKKIEVFKMKRRKDSRIHTGHRQKYCAVKITKIDTGVKKAKTEKSAEKPEEKTAKATAKTASQTKTKAKTTTKTTPKAKTPAEPKKSTKEKKTKE